MLITSTLMLACAGDSSDPMSKFHVKGVDPHNETSDVLTGFNKNIFSLELQSDIDNEFIVGEKKSIQFSIHENYEDIKVGKAEVNKEKSGIKNARLIKPSKNNRLYTLEWTADRYNIGNEVSKEITIYIDVSTDDENAATFNSLPINAVVKQNYRIPTIKNVSLVADTEHNEGSVVDFTVDVFDPNYEEGGKQPELKITKIAKTDRAQSVIDGSKRITDNIITDYQGANVFRFYKKLDFNNLEEYKNLSLIDICQSLQVVSSNKSYKSRLSDLCVKGRYIQGAVLNASADPVLAIMGQENALKFSFVTESTFANIEVIDADKTIARLTGEKELIKLDSSTATKADYLLKWTPSCNSNAKYKIIFDTVSSYNDSKKAEKPSIEIITEKSEVNCLSAAVSQGVNTPKLIAQNQGANQ